MTATLQNTNRVLGFHYKLGYPSRILTTGDYVQTHLGEFVTIDSSDENLDRLHLLFYELTQEAQLFCRLVREGNIRFMNDGEISDLTENFFSLPLVIKEVHDAH